MADLQFLRHLSLAPGQHPAGLLHLSAASALVRCGGQLYVVADDELHLGVFAEGDAAPGQLLRLFAGELAEDKAERKAQKPDLESLALLPAMPGYAQGALLALGSGSKPNRQQAVLLMLDAQGAVQGAPRLIDLRALYQPLHAQFADLNIEGAFLLGQHFILLQRGNQGQAANAAVRFAWPALQAWLLGEQGEAPVADSVELLALGELQGVALGFTDGAALADGRWLFSAVAENTADSYQDGACLGAIIGLVEADGQLRRLASLDGQWKVEGLAVQQRGEKLLLSLVTDADDPQIAASLLALELDLPS
ncbi:hypothetical protein HNE05_13455 [Aquipseudomonas campi]|uniref:DUF3616 domain-containing protein n=1 Tax=Aquipseudomonas campi TaxID=2731681 RepID=A0A6M8FU10_9GAMM|nr:hypothetical protein [Pseudomonas campi]QKE64318.1 hypothetical protein HNE05_13455 [Pseudomonas campi]